MLLTGEPQLLSKENDYLGHIERVKMIKAFLEGQYSIGGSFEKTTNDRMIALYGGRGTGKSSIMKTLCYSKNKDLAIKKNNFETIFFEARKYEGDDNLILSLIAVIMDQLKKKTHLEEEAIKIYKNIKKGIGGTIKGVTSSINLSATSSGEGGNLSIGINGKEFWEAYETYSKEAEAREFSAYKKSVHNDQKKIKDFFNKLLKNKKKVVIFVDDLDRCEPENVINLISVIKLFFTYSENVIFIVGIDKQAIIQSLSTKYGDKVKAEEYLEKIFTINFNIYNNLKGGDIVKKYGGNLDKDELSIIEMMLRELDFNNPRHTKKLMNKYCIIRAYSSFMKDDGRKEIRIALFVYALILSEFYNKYFEEFIIPPHESKIHSGFIKKSNGNINTTIKEELQGIGIINTLILPKQINHKIDVKETEFTSKAGFRKLEAILHHLNENSIRINFIYFLERNFGNITTITDIDVSELIELDINLF